MRRLTDEQIGLIAGRAPAIGDPTRVRILDVLAHTDQPVGQIATALDSDPSTISKHLQVLFHSGLVNRRRSASAVIHSIADIELLDWCRYLARPGSRRLGNASETLSYGSHTRVSPPCNETTSCCRLTLPSSCSSAMRTPMPSASA